MARDRITLNISLALAAAVALYFLSFPFGVYLVKRSGHDELLYESPVTVFYGPASWLVEQSSLYRNYYGYMLWKLGVRA